MGLFIKIVPVDFSTASRDKRELAVVKELGHDIRVVAKNDKRTSERLIIDGWDVHCRATRFFGQERWLLINRLLTILAWAGYVRKMKADYISGHNIEGILIAWISTWFTSKRKRPLLIYEAHEFELGRNADRKGLEIRGLKILERFLMKKAALTTVVSNSIAIEMQKIHAIPYKPVVVRNIPSYWEINEDICKKRRNELLTMMNIKEGNEYFVVMYHGGLGRGRGIENLIRVVSLMKNLLAVIIGNGQESAYVQSLHDLAREENAAERILFHPAVPIGFLWQYVGAADAGMVGIENVCLSYYFSLPNKLCENIQAEIPVIGSDFPEISSIIKGYNIGLTCDPHDINSIVAAIKEMQHDKEQYSLYKTSLKKAKRELCWEEEKKVLINAYTNLFATNNG